MTDLILDIVRFSNELGEHTGLLFGMLWLVFTAYLSYLLFNASSHTPR